MIYWTYDNLGRLINEKIDDLEYDSRDYESHYTYDIIGNRIELVSHDHGFISANPDENTVVTYTYDINDRLLVEMADAPGTADDTTKLYYYGPNADFTTTPADPYGGDHTTQTQMEVRTGLTTAGTVLQRTVYTYNAEGRLCHVEIDTDGDGTPEQVIDYTYNQQGIRVKQVSVDDTYGTVTTEYLIDANNHTGYAQVIEEIVTDYTGTRTDRMYAWGHDLISQVDTQMLYSMYNNVPVFFLYDGHGNTRILYDLDTLGLQSFRYDAFGKVFGGYEGAMTNHLYSGEYMDKATGLQYLRARYYNPSVGRFNRLDPYQGNLYDPQSLHKYLYCHADPVNEWDPTGEFSFSYSGLCITMSISAVIGSITAGSSYAMGGTAEQIISTTAL